MSNITLIVLVLVLHFYFCLFHVCQVRTKPEQLTYYITDC